MPGRQPSHLVLERVGQPRDVADAAAGRDQRVAQAGGLGVVNLGQLDEDRSPPPNAEEWS